MKRLFLMTLFVAALAVPAAAQEMTPAPVLDFGVFNTPTDAEEPGPALPGAAYSASFVAQPGEHLSFATMLVQTNDLFFAPTEEGIALFDEDGAPVTGDITEQILLWDAGTEVNEEPGVGENQAPRQAGPDTGDDEMGVVMVVDDGFEYPAVADLITVTLEEADGSFTLTVENISGESALPSPLAPGVWALHTEAGPLFFDGEADFGLGLEAIAEDGSPVSLVEALGGGDMMMTDAARSGEFVGAGAGYDGSGTATIEVVDGVPTLTFENFSVTNGPQLVILLAEGAAPTTSDALGEYVEISGLRPRRDSQSFELPADLDLSRFNSVVIYCKPFHVVFSYAPLS